MLPRAPVPSVVAAAHGHPLRKGHGIGAGHLPQLCFALPSHLCSWPLALFLLLETKIDLPFRAGLEPASVGMLISSLCVFMGL